MDDKMKKLLWISPYAPYDKVDHAGGKVHNFYVKYFHQSGKFDITLLSLCLKREESLLDLEQYGIKNQIFIMDQSKGKQFERRVRSAWSFINPFDNFSENIPTKSNVKAIKFKVTPIAKNHAKPELRYL